MDWCLYFYIEKGGVAAALGLDFSSAAPQDEP